MEYKLVINHIGWFAQFAEEVNAAVSEGWRPIGGVAAVVTGTKKFDIAELTLIQAMVRELPDDDTPG
jgi:hypothetical protein